MSTPQPILKSGPVKTVGPDNRSRVPETWAASRALEQEADKELMASHFALDDWLVRDTENPEGSVRETVASVLVNQGTTPKVVVREALAWIAAHSGDRVHHVTWYSPGALVPTTLHDFRQSNPELSAATQVHLFPGEVDLQLQAMISREAQEYARKITRCFTYMLLSSHSFDLDTGTVRFLFDREVPMQRTCALLQAIQKYLFLDSRKFSGEGEVGYGLGDLLATTSHSVTIYTVSSPQDAKMKSAFDTLAAGLLSPKRPTNDKRAQLKKLRLTIVGTSTATRPIVKQGYLRRSEISGHV